MLGRAALYSFFSQSIGPGLGPGLSESYNLGISKPTLRVVATILSSAELMSQGIVFKQGGDTHELSSRIEGCICLIISATKEVVRPVNWPEQLVHAPCVPAGLESK